MKRIRVVMTEATRCVIEMHDVLRNRAQSRRKQHCNKENDNDFTTDHGNGDKKDKESGSSNDRSDADNHGEGGGMNSTVVDSEQLPTGLVQNLETMEESFTKEYFASKTLTPESNYLSSSNEAFSTDMQWGFRTAPVSDGDRDKYNQLMSEPHNDEILITRFAVDITRYKISCLNDRTWLNDEVINFYMKMLKARDDILCIKNGKRKSWYFNSFFMERLLVTNKEYHYANVERSVFFSFHYRLNIMV